MFKDDIIVLDVETTFTVKKDEAGKPYSDYGSPYNRDNRVVRLGVWSSARNHYYKFDGVPDYLDFTGATIIGHNVKYDVLWLKAYGVKLEGVKLRDTMLSEHLLSRGERRSVSLSNTAPRYGGTPKADLVAAYWDAGYNTDQIPAYILDSYLYGDLKNTLTVYKRQNAPLKQYGLERAYRFSHSVLETVIEMEHNGCAYNFEAVAEVEKALYDARADAERALWEEIKKVAGKHFDQLQEDFAGKGKLVDSSQAMSKLVYGWAMNPVHKEKWAAFASRWKPYRDGAGRELQEALEKWCTKLDYGANLKFEPSWVQNATVIKGKYIGPNGLPASGKMLEAALEHADMSQKARRLVEALVRYSKTDTAITGNLAGFKKGLRDDGMIHGSFNQTGTTTYRFSSSDPNLQNLPREGTSPVKKLIRSRFPGGKLVACDYAQLEFRVVGMLANDRQLVQDVLTDFDIHSHTAKQAFKGKWKPDESPKSDTNKPLRTKAKTITFAFQYGAMPKNSEQQAIYDAFYGKYIGVKQWQDMVAGQIMMKKEYVCPFTGQPFLFPEAQYQNRFSWSTKAKNYPVQYLAARVTQAAMIGVYRRIKGRDDIKLILQVHDSLVLDAKPEVVEEAERILQEEMVNVSAVFKEFFDVELSINFSVDASVGDTYYDV